MKKKYCKEVIEIIARAHHSKHFPEEYFFIGDSLLDAKERQRGVNPMSEEYITRVNQRRIDLGFSALGKNGLAKTNDTLEFSQIWADKVGKVSEAALESILLKALRKNDPIKIDEENQRYKEVSVIITVALFSGASFEKIVPESLGRVFGFALLKHLHLASLYSEFERGVVNHCIDKFT